MHEQEAAVAGTLEGEENQEEKVPIQVKLCWHLTNLGKHMPALRVTGGEARASFR